MKANKGMLSVGGRADARVRAPAEVGRKAKHLPYARLEIDEAGRRPANPACEMRFRAEQG